MLFEELLGIDVFAVCYKNSRIRFSETVMNTLDCS